MQDIACRGAGDTPAVLQKFNRNDVSCHVEHHANLGGMFSLGLDVKPLLQSSTQHTPDSLAA